VSDQKRTVFDRLYKSAAKPEDLPWHNAEPPALLVKALDRRDAPGSALDIGCGAGTCSIYMAKRDYQVTAIDFMPQAITMLGDRIADSDLAITPVQADVAKWRCEHPVDVVLDVGCLHARSSLGLDAYKLQLLNWLAPGGDFILDHFGRRGWWDWWPIGPNRVFADVLQRHFAPEFELLEQAPELRHGFPLFLGRSALVGHYWFRRTQTEA